ncbi:RDD family protein [Cellvibrio sp. UBA7661]|uniref:RDD family protein n=1 Tax=Cellvibrio sp. UBA7661 TaxID=1946311 RepID=UPI002F355E12
MNDQTPDSQPEFRSHQPAMDNTASYGKRFGAFVIDTVLMMVALVFLLQYLGLEPSQSNDMEAAQAEMIQKLQNLPDSSKRLLAFSPIITFFLLHGFLLHQFGQTIGKRILGIAIVTMDNQKPPFLMLILQRYVSQWLMGMVPVIGLLLRLADIVFIFRADKRCIHDHLAKTKVIDLRIPVVVTGKPNSIIV